MKEKRNIHELIVKEEPHLNQILDPEQVSKFKELTNELRDTWTKKQMFRTKTEMEFSVLNDAKYPTNAAKYWQCVREQNTHMENLMQLSFEARKNDIEINFARKQLGEELIIGVSCYNSPERAIEAQDIGANYVAFGSIFNSKTKSHLIFIKSKGIIILRINTQPFVYILIIS